MKPSEKLILEDKLTVIVLSNVYRTVIQHAFEYSK